jgi:hypothetical protein
MIRSFTQVAEREFDRNAEEIAEKKPGSSRDVVAISERCRAS